MSKEISSVFISHGGGPMPLLGDPGHDEMVTCLRNLATRLPRPDAIIVASAHWEERVPTITAAMSPELIYDYYGFPEESYSITYPCPGEPSLANELQVLFKHSGLEAILDDRRGLDHGVFVPLKIMYPDADIPCIQLSLLSSLDPESHIAMGQVLRNLKRDNVLLLGSGFSFHNLKAFFSTSTPESEKLNREFEKWLADVCCNEQYSAQERRSKLINWSVAPGAHHCHPREEHLLPLHVCWGASSGSPAEVIELDILNKQSSMYVW